MFCPDMTYKDDCGLKKKKKGYLLLPLLLLCNSHKRVRKESSLFWCFAMPFLYSAQTLYSCALRIVANGFWDKAVHLCVNPWHCVCFGDFPFRRCVNAVLSTSQGNINFLHKYFAGIEGLVKLIFEIRHQLAKTAAMAVRFNEIGSLCADVTDTGPRGASYLLSPRKTTLLSDVRHRGDANAVHYEYLQRQTFEPPCRILSPSHRVYNKL